MINYPQCTLEIYLDGRWQAAATLELLGGQGAGTDAATRITYLVEYALDHLDRHDAAALSATLPVTFDLIRSDAWPAMAVDLLPQGYGRQELARRLGVPAHFKNSDWPLLLAGAGNPIGNVRVAEASAYAKAQTGSSRGFTRDEIISRAESFMEFLANEGYFVAGSSGVTGYYFKIVSRHHGKCRASSRCAPNCHGEAPPKIMKQHFAMTVSPTPALPRRERGTKARFASFTLR
jgi:serine/threonine-protein kinase HipA